VQSRNNQSHQRGVGGFTLAPVTIAAKAISLPSPALSPNLLQPFNRVLGDSSPVSTGSHTKPCHVDWSTMNRLFHEGDAVGAFSLVLERGELEDLVRAMEVLGPRPDVSMLNILSCAASHVFDLMFDSFFSCVKSCLNTFTYESTDMTRIQLSFCQHRFYESYHFCPPFLNLPPLLPFLASSFPCHCSCCQPH
jgi:hypothetical protein